MWCLECNMYTEVGSLKFHQYQMHGVSGTSPDTAPHPNLQHIHRRTQ